MSSMRRTRGLVVILAVVIAMPAAAGGTLCFMLESTCSDGLSFDPSPRERRAVWLDGEQPRVAVLVIGPGQRTADPESAAGEIRLQLGTRRLPRGARAIDFILRDAGGRTWQWTLPGRVASPVIAAPHGLYTLEVSAPQAKTRSVSSLRLSAAQRRIDAGLIDLEPKLTVAGTVVDPLGVPVAGASILDPAGVQLAATGADGAFVIDAAGDELPPSVIVRAKGFALHEVRVPDRRLSLDAGRLILDRGATVRVTVAFDESPAHPRPRDLRVGLYRVGPKRQLLTELPLREDGTATFSGVATGRYVVLAEGAGPLQKYGEFLDVAEPAEVERELRIEPVRLDGFVYRGAEPLAGATITLIAPREVWRASQTVGADGDFGGVLWQRGHFAAMVQGGTLATPFLADNEVAVAEASWDIAIPDRQIAGSVTDSKSGNAIAGARVIYESLGTSMRLSSYVVADERGRFAITGLPEGTIRMHAVAAGHLPSTPIEIGIRPDDPSAEVSLPLDAGAMVRVRVVDDRQHPIAGATVIDGIDATGTQTLSRPVTDGAGEVVLPVLAGTPKKIYVIPREGSFAAAVVRAEDAAPERPLTVTVPSLTGALVVNARTETLDPIPRLHFLVRYNGEVLPQAFWTLLQHTQGFNLVTDGGGVARHPRLPPGLYELWPFASRAEGRSMYLSPEVLAPLAKIGINAGDEQVVTLTFASR